MSGQAERRRAVEKGRLGEARAAAYLAAKGYGIVARNFRSRAGEVDIIAEKDGTLAFVEVKTWDAFGPEELEYSIGRSKQRKIRSAARAFLRGDAENPAAWLHAGGRGARFDVILVGADTEEGVLHIENAFNGAVREWYG